MTIDDLLGGIRGQIPYLSDTKYAALAALLDWLLARLRGDALAFDSNRGMQTVRDLVDALDEPQHNEAAAAESIWDHRAAPSF